MVKTMDKYLQQLTGKKKLDQHSEQNYRYAVNKILKDQNKDPDTNIETFVEDPTNQRKFAKYVGFEVLDLWKRLFDQKYSVVTKGIDSETQSYMIYKNIYLVEEKENTSKRTLLIQNFSDLDLRKILNVHFDKIALATRQTLNAIILGQNSINKDINEDIGAIDFLKEILKQAEAKNASDVKISLRKHILHFKLTLGSQDEEVAQFSLKEALIVRNTLEYLAGQENGERSYDSKIVLDGIEYRINFWESAFGWRATIRVFDNNFHSDKTPDLKVLGYEEPEETLIEDIIQYNSGLILFTAGTGHGKTTSLNAIADKLARMGLDVLTAEDPVEQFLSTCDQIDTTVFSTASEDLKVTKRKAVKHFLRSKPNVIILGEIRDLEDMELAYNASVTGHLVLATLHAESILTAFKRLSSTGMDEEDLKSITRGIVYQRLWKQLCNDCKIKEGDHYKANPKGCNECNCGYQRTKTPINEIAKFHTMKEWSIKDTSSYESYIALNDSAKRKLDLGIIDQLHYDAIVARKRDPKIMCEEVKNGN